MSYVGASITTIATEGILFALLYCCISNDLYRLSLWGTIMKPIAAGAIMG
jgi:hypothetical protein